MRVFFFVYILNKIDIYSYMITIAKNQNVNIFITLTDKRLTTSDIYIFTFENEVTGEEVVLTLTDVSEFEERVSKFAVTDEDFADSTVGFYRYFVRQSGSGSTIIATGKMNLTEPNLSTAGVVRYNGYNGDYKTYTTA